VSAREQEKGDFSSLSGVEIRAGGANCGQRGYFSPIGTGDRWGRALVARSWRARPVGTWSAQCGRYCSGIVALNAVAVGRVGLGPIKSGGLYCSTGPGLANPFSNILRFF
jgi:hypothetical protein